MAKARFETREYRAETRGETDRETDRETGEEREETGRFMSDLRRPTAEEEGAPSRHLGRNRQDDGLQCTRRAEGCAWSALVGSGRDREGEGAAAFSAGEGAPHLGEALGGDGDGGADLGGEDGDAELLDEPAEGVDLFFGDAAGEEVGAFFEPVAPEG